MVALRAVALAALAASAASASVAIEGRVTFFVEDHFDANLHFKYGELVTPTGEKHLFHMGPNVAHLKSGDTASVTISSGVGLADGEVKQDGKTKGPSGRGARRTGVGVAMAADVTAAPTPLSKQDGRTRRQGSSSRSAIAITLYHPESGQQPWCDAACVRDDWQ